MDIIKQEKPFDCGVPCIAMLVGIDYDAAWDICLPHMSDSEGRIPFIQLAEIIESQGLKANIVEGSIPEGNNVNCLCEVTYFRNNTQQWHYIVWDSFLCTFLDPNHSPSDTFTVMRFIEVSKY